MARIMVVALVALLVTISCLHSVTSQDPMFEQLFDKKSKQDGVEQRFKRHSSEHDHHHYHNHINNFKMKLHNQTGYHLNHTEAESIVNLALKPLEHSDIMDYFFQKYGNGTHIFFEAVEHMWKSFDFNDHSFDHSIEQHKDKHGAFVPMHADHDHHKAADDHDHSHGRDDDFKELRDHVGNISEAASSNGCLSAMQLYDVLKLRINQTISKSQFLNLCPFILSQMEKKACRPVPLKARKGVPNSCFYAWVGALVSVSVISVAGLVVISIVPILSKSKHFEHVAQFLISLAVGTLTSDALLHLLPHAMVPHSHEASQEPMDIPALNHKYVTQLSHNALWVGLVTFASIVFFFIVERLLKAIARKNHTQTTEQIEIKVMAEDGQATFQNGGPQAHNHSHHVPSGILSSAWMVAMGDGLHNFADGLAIGASFASSLSVGLSTSVAVLCHELPHELGDFASLLTAGMSTKQAIFCNLVSSLLCLTGVCLGVSIGNYVQSLTTWVFAVIAGIFLYIALVDMLPQMTKTYENPSEAADSEKEGGLMERLLALVQDEWVKRLLLHLSGVGLGLTIMLLIGLYEDRIVIEVV